MKKKTSLKDIAAVVGVSTALVSYVLNNKKEGRIRKEVAEKIRQVALKLDYHPNQIAKSLKTNRTNTLGLIVADISNPFSSALARIIEDEAERQGYTVIYGSSDENATKCGRLIETLLNRQVDGLIIFPPEGTEDQIKRLKKRQIPFVLVDRYFPGIDTNYVSLDNYAASFAASQHLVEVGRKRIGMITYKSSLVHLLERKRGYLGALKHSGRNFRKHLLKEVSISNDVVEIETAVRSMLSSTGRADAILFGSNRIAATALKYISSLPVLVPQQLALVGFDESEIFDFFRSPLTFIRQPLAEMGRIATCMVIEQPGTQKKTRQVQLAAELIIRQSSATE
jgi:LacI family transcriptional regulator, galactose operon repressor